MKDKLPWIIGFGLLLMLALCVGAQPPAPDTNNIVKLSPERIKALRALITIQPTNPPPPLSKMAWYACPPQQQWGVQFGILQSTRSMVPPILWQDVAFAAADGTWHTNSFDPSNKPVYFRVVYGPITKTN